MVDWVSQFVHLGEGAEMAAVLLEAVEEGLPMSKHSHENTGAEGQRDTLAP